MIELKAVNKFYGKNHAIKDVSFHVEKGQTLVLLGRSGCGKTTTLKMINRLIPFDSGDILINEQSVMDWNPTQLRRNIGYVFQNIGLFPHLNIYENLVIVPKLLRWEKEKVAKWLDNVLGLLQIDRAIAQAQAPPAFWWPAAAHWCGPGPDGEPGHCADGRTVWCFRSDYARRNSGRVFVGQALDTEDDYFCNPRYSRSLYDWRPDMLV